MPFELDKIYVIESLPVDERTGIQLYNDVIRWFEDYHGISSEYREVASKEELIKVLEDIAAECNENNFKPLIHFEIHGLNDRSGLLLLRDSILWDELSYYLRKINKSSNWSLNLTMAVCFGNYFLGSLSPIEPCPVAGIVGSFEKISEGELVLRFEEFYTKLRDNLNLDEAILAMMNQNREFVSGFAYIDARRIFCKAYNLYLEQQFTVEALMSRYMIAKEHEGNTLPSDDEFQSFVQILLNSREYYFERHKRVFFMIDEFPENEARFPISLNEVI